jgi:hypothetical protein
MAKATRFFPRGLRVTGQSGPQDVSCGVLVGRRAMTATLTSELCLADAIHFGGVPTSFAAVGGVAWTHLNQCAPRIFRIGAQE